MLIDVPATLAQRRDGIIRLGGEIDRYRVVPPAKQHEVDEVVRQIGRALPAVLRKLFLEQAAAIQMSWSLRTVGPLADVLGGEIGGEVDLSLFDVPADWFNWSGWRDAFEDPAAYDWPVEFNLEVYRELFPVVAVANGDQIVVAEPDDETTDLVLYLNHESGDFAFAVLSDTLESFFNSWFSLACPGPDFADLALFMRMRDLRVSTTARRSATWLRAITDAAV